MSSPFRLIDLPYRHDLSAVYAAVRQYPQSIWLDSGRPISTQGRYDIVSAAPLVTVSTQGLVTTTTSLAGIKQTSSDNPFDIVKALLPAIEDACNELPFTGGALGYFGYDLGRHIERLPNTTNTLANVPDMLIGIYPWAVISDHELKTTKLLINNALLTGADAPYPIDVIVDACLTATTKPIAASTFFVSAFAPHITHQHYEKAFERIQTYIHAGDCYQINYAQPFSATCSGDSFMAYQQLRQSMGSPYSGLMEWDNGALLCLSPERFIEVDGNHVETKPIKGTVARGVTPDDDQAAIAWLTTSEKNRAENIMIVDLLRNDLSKHCDQVDVPHLCAIESFPNVHHLVSTVTGRRREESHPLDILRDAFPGGSITGAPKVRAMEIIEELETVKRSIYCGSLGYISTHGRMDTNIAIRSLIRDKNTLHCWGGGGIVADSEAILEYQESIAKVHRLLSTLESCFSTDSISASDS